MRQVYNLMVNPPFHQPDPETELFFSDLHFQLSQVPLSAASSFP